MTVRIMVGDCRNVLATLPDESVHCVVTSPPYFGLRDYGTARWEGGTSDCDHLAPAAHGYNPHETSSLGPKRDGLAPSNSAHSAQAKRQQFKSECRKCGALRIDGQIGLEPTPDAFVDEIVTVFRALRRVLRDDGTAWLNLGDSYNAHPGQRKTTDKVGAKQETNAGSNTIGSRSIDGIKAKDLIGVPWLVAFALRADGWYLRQDIIWSKPNPMPESVRDRCTKAHEYLFLLSKSERYHFDQDAILEPAALSSIERLSQPTLDAQSGSDRVPGKTNGPMKAVGRGGKNAFRGQGHFRDGENGPANRDGRDMRDVGVSERRNKRSVWEVTTQPFSEAHFATFPPALIEPCILAGCPKGGTVLDPFGGAGTTGLVADRLGRNAILIELNPDYAAMAQKRIEAEGGMFAEVDLAATQAQAQKDDNFPPFI